MESFKGNSKIKRVLSMLCFISLVFTLSLSSMNVNVSAAGESLRLEMYNMGTASSVAVLTPQFKLYNTGSTTIDLTKVKIKYFYTVDGDAVQQFSCNSATVGITNITGTFVKMNPAVSNADYYAEIGFNAGSIAPGNDTIVCARITKTNNSTYIQTNDYSFCPSGTTYISWTKAVASFNGINLSGTEPYDLQKPTIPTNLTITSKSKSSLSLSWTASTDNVGVTGYKITRNDGVISNSTSTSFVDSNLLPNTYYTYKVQAYDLAGNYSDMSNTVDQFTLKDAPLNISRYLYQGKVSLTSSYEIFGQISSCADGNLATEFLGDASGEAAKNPCVLKFTFTEAQTFNKICLMLGTYGATRSIETNAYRIEAADSEDELKNLGPSHVEITTGTNSSTLIPSVTDTRAYDVVNFSPVKRKIWAISVKRTDTNNIFLTIPEIEFYGINSPIALSPSPNITKVNSFYTTANLTWNKIDRPDVTGYAIYRSNSSGVYDYKNPVARVINDYKSGTVMFNDYNLSPATKYYYRIAAYNIDNEFISGISSEVSVLTSSTNRYINRVSSLKMLVPMYNIPPNELDKMINSVKKGVEFYYRNSFGKLNIEPTFFVINEDLTNAFENVENDLKTKGIYPDQFDLMFIVSPKSTGWYGGFTILGAHCGHGYSNSYSYNGAAWQEQMDQFFPGELWIFLHEECHALGSLVEADGSWFINADINCSYPQIKTYYPDFNAGRNADIISNILRCFNGYNNFKAPHNDYIEYLDYDADGLADNDERLPVDEQRFGSYFQVKDYDQDGLNDMQEYAASYYKGTNPSNADSDGDSIPDGQDATPLSDFSSTIKKFTQAPDIYNGVISSSWTFLGSKPVKNMDSTLNAKFYSGWDDNNLYLAVKSNKKIEIWLNLDGSGQNGFAECDGYFAQDDGTIRQNWTNAETEIAKNYGDCYVEDYCLVIDPTNSKVSFANKSKNTNNSAIAQSVVTCKVINGEYVTMCKIPRNLGHGFAYSYWAPGSPLINGVRLTADRILGFEIAYTAFDTQSPSQLEPDRNDILNNANYKWCNLSEPNTFYKVKLVN